MTQKILFSICFILLILSCKDEANLISSFPTTEQIKGVPIENIKFQSKGGINLVSIDSFLVVQKRENSILQIYNTKNYNLLSEFGTNGKGPDEFIWPELTNQTSYDKINNSPVVYIYDYTQLKFTEINILNSINNQTDKIFKNIPIPKCNQYLKYFFYRDNDLMIATPGNSRFVIYKDSTKQFKAVPFLPATDISISEHEKRFVYRSASCINKKKGIMASAPMGLGEIDFFDLEGNYISSTIFSSSKDLKNDLKNYNPKYHIVEMHANNKYIYALNHDNYQNDFSDNHNRSNQNRSNQSILVFDWKGNPIKRYVLDKKCFIHSFAVDWENNRFYGYCSNNSENPIIAYKINAE